MRTLVLTFPRLGIQLLRAASPAIAGRPVALLSGEADAALIADLSCEATADGVEVGMTVAQARQRCPGITFERDNARECLERIESIASILKTRATTSVAIVSRNSLAISLDGLDFQFRDEAAAAQTILGIARAWSGLDIRGAVGSNLHDALHAARTARRFAVVVPPTESGDRVLPRFEPVAATHAFDQAATSAEALGRLGKMAAALQAFGGNSYRKVTLEIERGAYRTAFAVRPPQPLHRAGEALEAIRSRVAPGDLKGATAIRLSLELPGPSVSVQPWRAASATVHQLSAPAVPVQRRLRLAS